MPAARPPGIIAVPPAGAGGYPRPGFSTPGNGGRGRGRAVPDQGAGNVGVGKKFFRFWVAQIIFERQSRGSIPPGNQPSLILEIHPTRDPIVFGFLSRRIGRNPLYKIPPVSSI